MSDRNGKGDREQGRNETPGPAEESDTGTIGNTDEKSSENRREGLKEDRERARRPSDVSDPEGE